MVPGIYPVGLGFDSQLWNLPALTTLGWLLNLSELKLPYLYNGTSENSDIPTKCKAFGPVPGAK